MARPATRGTTKCSSLFLVCLATALLIAGSARAEVLSEAELVRAFWAASPQQAAISAARQRRKAAATVAPYLPHPELVLRREQSLGAATEFSTTVAGLELTLEIGGRHGLHQRAARLDAEALGSRWRAHQVTTACGLRGLAREAHALARVVAILSANQRRLEGLALNLKRLVEAGELAAFDLTRLQLQVQIHGQTLAARRARLAGLQAHLSALCGRKITGIRLAAPPSSPSPAVPHEVQALRLQARAEQQRAAALARRWVPDLGLYGAYRADTAPKGDPGHGYEVGLTLNLPLTDSHSARRARTEAHRRQLLALATAKQARRRAVLARLAARSGELKKALQHKGVDPQRLERAAAARYLKGVSPLSGLLDTLQGLEQAALQRAKARAALGRMSLEAACARGSMTNGITRTKRKGTP